MTTRTYTLPVIQLDAASPVPYYNALRPDIQLRQGESLNVMSLDPDRRHMRVSIKANAATHAEAAIREAAG